MSKRQLTTPEELADYIAGKKRYNAGEMVEACTTQAQRQGWYAAMNKALNMMCLDWQSFTESPSQTIRFSEAAFKEVAYNNEYSFQGVDYIEPSVQ